MTTRPQGSNRGTDAAQQIALVNSTGVLTANSTALIVAKALRIGAKTFYLTSNSTGVKLGAKYISVTSVCTQT